MTDSARPVSRKDAAALKAHATYIRNCLGPRTNAALAESIGVLEQAALASLGSAPLSEQQQRPVAWRYRLRSKQPHRTTLWRYVDSPDEVNPSPSYEVQSLYERKDVT